MTQMFYRSVFNQDIGDWDVSAVAYMSRIFYRAAVFNQSLGWCTSADLNLAFFESSCINDCGVTTGDC